MGATHAIAASQARAKVMARGMQDSENLEGVHLTAQDQVSVEGRIIYVYNILDRDYVVEQPPKFPHFAIPRCPKGERFSFTILPAFSKDTFFESGNPNRTYYRVIDGRKDATSLLNPDAFPGTQWESQLANWDSEQTAITGAGNNLNRWGVFWSETAPHEEEKLEEEIKLFRTYVGKTMNGLVKQAELLAAQGKLQEITPNMHFAMDYLGKTAAWHMTMDHMVSCPNCGDLIKDGIAYHRNSFGDKCIVDEARCIKLGILVRPEEAKPEADADVATKKSGRKTS